MRVEAELAVYFLRNLSALKTTEVELRLMARAATAGEIKEWVMG
jgi:hypothetical protein